MFKRDINQEYLNNEKAFFREIPKHPSIVNFIDSGTSAEYTNSNGVKEDNRYYIAMEYIEGGEFLQFTRQGPLEPKIAKKYFTELLLGMHHIHKNGLAHRDLKPDNLLITSEAKLKVADFGLSHKLDCKIDVNEKHGSNDFMAPELQKCSDCKTYSGDQVDLFSAGVILYLMMTATLPFDSATAEDEKY
jgi:serine/threonine protein kinase